MPGTGRTLRDLVNDARQKHADETGVPSFHVLAQKAREAQFPIVHTTLAAIAAGTYAHKPQKPTLRAIAFLAGVSYETAREAAGLGKAHKPFAEELPPESDQLWPENRRAIKVLIRAILNTQDASLNPDRVTTEGGPDHVWADEAGIFGPDELTRSEQQL